MKVIVKVEELGDALMTLDTPTLIPKVEEDVQTSFLQLRLLKRMTLPSFRTPLLPNHSNPGRKGVMRAIPCLSAMHPRRGG